MALRDISETQTVSRLIALIYDAALDPSKWRSFVDAIPEVMPGFHSALYLTDPRTNLMDTFLMSENWNHDFLPENLACTEQLNHGVPKLSSVAPTGTQISGKRYITSNDLKKTGFYSDFLSNFEKLDNAPGTVINRGKDNFGRLVIYGNDTTMKQDGRKIARVQKLLAQHITKAFEISRRLDHGSLTAETLEQTLEALTSAVLVIDKYLLVQSANGAARQLFLNKTLALDAHCALAAGSRMQETRKLRKALKQALQPGQSNPGNQYISLTGARGRQRLFAQIMPLTGPLSAPAENGVPRPLGKSRQALLIITDPALEQKNLRPLLSITYGLTATEIQLATALANGDSLSSYAQSAGIKVNTARSLLKIIFSKTDTHRQAELVALMARITTPFNHSDY